MRSRTLLNPTQSPGSGKAMIWRPPSGSSLKLHDPSRLENIGQVAGLPLVDEFPAGFHADCRTLEARETLGLALRQLHECAELFREMISLVRHSKDLVHGRRMSRLD